jgi:hypothetical protein
MSRVARFGWAVALATGCGSGSTDNPTTGIATFSGAATGTLKVSVLGAYTPPSSDVIFIIDSSPSSYPNLNFTAKLPGTALVTGTFTAAAANVTDAITDYFASSGGEPAWQQLYLAQPPTETGAFSLVLTSLGGTTGDDTGTDWPNTHGSLSAALPALSLATGDVNVSIAF